MNSVALRSSASAQPVELSIARKAAQPSPGTMQCGRATDVLDEVVAGRHAFGYYVATLRRIPLLSRQEEAAITSPQTSDRLVAGNLRLVVKIAHQYHCPPGLSFADLVQQGNLGLLKARERFDKGRGLRFSTYAHWWVRERILDCIRAKWVELGVQKVAAKKLVLGFARKLEQAQREAGEEGDVCAVLSREHHVGVQAVRNFMQRMNGHDVFLGPGCARWVERRLSEEQPLRPDLMIEQRELGHAVRRIIEQALPSLADARMRYIIKHRLLADDGIETSDVAARFSISANRARELERGAKVYVRILLEEAGISG